MRDLPSLEQLRNARTKYDIASALDALARAPERFPVDPLIVQMASDERWLVRHAALAALGNAIGPGIEDVLLAAAARAQVLWISCTSTARSRELVVSGAWRISCKRYRTRRKTSRHLRSQR
jgi:hypothetical protein